MTTVRARGEDVRRYILDTVAEHTADIAKVTSDHFAISRQAVGQHLGKLVADGSLNAKGNTRSRRYALLPLASWSRIYSREHPLEEFDVWQNDIRSILHKLPENVFNIWHYGFTEMFNNAIDHAGGTYIRVAIRKTASTTEMMISDDGVGIFEKIQKALGLQDPRHAILELSKGKLTTDPKRHTGEGIFFTSRMMDKFDIMSQGVFFTHSFGEIEDWILENDSSGTGTAVWMLLHNHTARTAKVIFDKYVTGDDYGFTMTVVPVKLARYGNDLLVSRSQAKRVLARNDLFQKVIFDFATIDSIGPAFADEIFRVFASQHPEIRLVAINQSRDVRKMIDRARAAGGIPFDDAATMAEEEQASKEDEE